MQFVKRALFLGWERARAKSFILKLATCMEDSLVLVHDETRYAEAESSGFHWTPRVQSAAARSLVPTPSDETKYVQGTAVDDSSVRLHDEGQAVADFIDQFSWKEIGLKHMPNGREETETARDGTPGLIMRRIVDGIPEPIREQPTTTRRSEEEKEALVPRHQRRSMNAGICGAVRVLDIAHREGGAVPTAKDVGRATRHSWRRTRPAGRQVR